MNFYPPPNQPQYNDRINNSNDSQLYYAHAQVPAAGMPDARANNVNVDASQPYVAPIRYQAPPFQVPGDKGAPNAYQPRHYTNPYQYAQNYGYTHIHANIPRFPVQGPQPVIAPQSQPMAPKQRVKKLLKIVNDTTDVIDLPVLKEKKPTTDAPVTNYAIESASLGTNKPTDASLTLASTSGKRRYEREFLLKIMDQAKEKPKCLPDIPNVIIDDRYVKKSNKSFFF